MRKLFYEDIHITEFTASVISCEWEEQKNGYRVVLDATAFFPEEGGQTADKGTLNGEPVFNVSEKKGIIYHYIAHPFSVGSIVTGQVDWEQRFDFMQQHSGEHILSGLVSRLFGFRNVGFHLSPREVTLDFDGELTKEQVRQLEIQANEVIYQNLPIEISYPSKETLAALSYRSKIEIEGQVRIVAIPGVDICACCAPHVSATGVIGMIKIVSCQSHRGGVRLTILCGKRALTDYAKKQDNLLAVSTLLSTHQEQISDAVVHLKEEIQLQKEKNYQLQARYLQQCIRTLPSPEQSEHALLFVPSVDTVAIRNTVNELTKRYSGYCAVFSETNNGCCQFIVGSRQADCQVLAKKLRQELNAKCGGNAVMIQGSIQAEKERILSCISEEKI